MKKLTINEQIYLIAIRQLEDQAYGIKIRERIYELTGSRILFGTLYNTLEYLVKKGYVAANKKYPIENSQDRKRVYYLLSQEGKQALRQAWELQNNLWKDMREFSSGDLKKS